MPRLASRAGDDTRRVAGAARSASSGLPLLGGRTRTRRRFGFDIFPSSHELFTLFAERPPFVGKSRRLGDKLTAIKCCWWRNWRIALSHEQRKANVEFSENSNLVRVPVGTHYRVWWFWLPLILGGFGLLVAAVLLPVARPLGIAAGLLAAGLGTWAVVSAVVIRRGRRWLEDDVAAIRIIGREGTLEFTDEEVTDLALFHVPHHAGGRLVAVSRELRLWIEMPHGEQQLRLVNRMAPHSRDPLEELIGRLCEQLTQRAVDRLARRKSVDGDGWRLEGSTLCVTNGQEEASLATDTVAAVETIGQEIRVWREGTPRAVIRLPLSGRNTWMLERLLSVRSASVARADRSAKPSPPASPLGRILFERVTGPTVSVLFAMVGLVLTVVGLMTLFLSIRAGQPFGGLVGVLLDIIGALLLVVAWRARRMRFNCYEHGLERITLTGRQVLRFSEVDVFSFESRRNFSHGRYAGTTYTLVFADRSREQGRGLFFSTTVHNTDEELEMLRDRVAEQIARRMAATFARTRRVQWTPELWFHDDVLEFSRPRRLLARPKLTVVPYDAVTDFEARDGMFHLWTNYQERAVISVKTSSANFYPGLIVLEGLVKAHVREPVDEWSPSTTMG